MQVKLRHASEFTPEKNGKRIYCVNFWVPTPNTLADTETGCPCRYATLNLPLPTTMPTEIADLIYVLR